MKYPALKIDLQKLKHNTKIILDLCGRNGISIAGVTKVFCASPILVKCMMEEGISTIADSRIENLKKLSSLPVEKMLLRLPMPSQAEDVVRFSHISLNSEIETIRALSQAASKRGIPHKIILMIDWGDLREGILPENTADVVEKIITLPNIELNGLGVNLNCYGGVIPSTENLSALVALAKETERKFSIRIPVISGGNSGSLHLVKSGKIPKGVNQLRIGEAIVRGYETSFGQPIPGAHLDIFTFCAEVIEVQKKPSIPFGEIGVDAFGKKSTFQDKGSIWRAILACGRQDVLIEGLTPLSEGVEVLGGSSDHLILDVSNMRQIPSVGDIMEFRPNYGSILAACTSEFVEKTVL